MLCELRKSEDMSDLVPDGNDVVGELVDLLLDRIRINKELGQHFLTNEKILQRAVEISGVGCDSHILEIGPGPGTLTHFLLAIGSKVTAIEFDRIVVEHLQRVHSQAIESGQLTLIEGDALRVGWPKDLTHIVSNPPYQISSPLLSKIDTWQNEARRRGDDELESVVLLLQDEFASRLAMEFGIASRGPLGSRLVFLKPRNLMKDLEIDVEPRLVKRIVDHAFAERRRKMKNRLKGTPRKIERVPNWNRKSWRQVADILLSGKEEIDLESGWEDFRPEDLEVNDWLILAQKFEHINNELDE